MWQVMPYGRRRNQALADGGSIAPAGCQAGPTVAVSLSETESMRGSRRPQECKGAESQKAVQAADAGWSATPSPLPSAV